MKDKKLAEESHQKHCQRRRAAERLLVVSDNLELSLFLKGELDRHVFRHPFKVAFCYTALNKNPEPLMEVGFERINVKEEATIDRICLDFDLVFSLHCKQVFPKRLVESVCCMNFHPGFNPFNRGWFPQAFSIVNGLPIGATIHLMDSEIDHGAIITQREVNIAMSDTSLEVYRKVLSVEKELIRDNIVSIIEGVFEAVPPVEEGNYNGIQDYRALCELDLEAVGSLGHHINLLRALSHGRYKNAYYTDESGKKYYIRVVIEEETLG